MPVAPGLARTIIRNGNWPKPTPGLNSESGQVNLAVLPMVSRVCEVTPQAVALESKPSLMVTHSPECMLITDIKDEHLAAL